MNATGLDGHVLERAGTNEVDIYEYVWCVRANIELVQDIARLQNRKVYKRCIMTENNGKKVQCP